MRRPFSKVLHVVASLKVAIVLFILIALYIVIGTLIPQHGAPQMYLDRYPTLGKLILTLDLDTSYSSTIFIILVILFAINLTTCTLLSIKGQMRQQRSSFFPVHLSSEYALTDITSEEAHAYLSKKRYKVVEEEQGTLKASKFRWGVFGSTLTHIGLLVLFLGGTITQCLSTETMVNLMPGQSRMFQEQGFVLRVDDFHMTFEDDGSVKQYISDVTATDIATGETRSDQMWVNKPFRYKNLGFYQASFGWTGHLHVADQESKELLTHGDVRAGGTYFHEDTHTTVYLYGYYPEFAIGHGQQPISLSNREINPHFAVVLYEFNNPVDTYIVEPGDEITHNGIVYSFTHATAYTGLLVRSDPSFPVILASFIIILLGMFVSFYCYPRFILYSEGKIITSSRRNEWVFFHSVKKGFSDRS